MARIAVLGVGGEKNVLLLPEVAPTATAPERKEVRGRRRRARRVAAAQAQGRGERLMVVARERHQGRRALHGRASTGQVSSSATEGRRSQARTSSTTSSGVP